MYSLSYRLGAYKSGLDSDAAAYISVIEGNGAAVSSTQRNAINDFIKTGKLEGWYSALKRLYFPIWAAESPNEVDMITRASGTFNGTVTHGSGFVQSNGIDGWFDTGATPGALGMSPSTAYLCALAKTEMNSSRAIGSRNNISQDMNIARLSTNLACGIMTNSSGAGLIQTAATCSGILSGSRVGGTRFIARRNAAGRSNLSSVMDADFGTTPTANIGLMAGNVVATGPVLFSNNEFGAFVIGTGLTDAQDEDLTLALKNLWETCTGLPLP